MITSPWPPSSGLLYREIILPNVFVPTHNILTDTQMQNPLSKAVLLLVCLEDCRAVMNMRKTISIHPVFSNRALRIFMMIRGLFGNTL